VAVTCSAFQDLQWCLLTSVCVASSINLSRMLASGQKPPSPFHHAHPIPTPPLPAHTRSADSALPPRSGRGGGSGGHGWGPLRDPQDAVAGPAVAILYSGAVRCGQAAVRTGLRVLRRHGPRPLHASPAAPSGVHIGHQGSPLLCKKLQLISFPEVQLSSTGWIAGSTCTLPSSIYTPPHPHSALICSWVAYSSLTCWRQRGSCVFCAARQRCSLSYPPPLPPFLP